MMTNAGLRSGHFRLIVLAALAMIFAGTTPSTAAVSSEVITCNTYYNWTETDVLGDDPFHTSYEDDAEDLEPGGEWVKFGEVNSVRAYGTEHPTAMLPNYTLASGEHTQDLGCSGSGSG